MARLAPPAGQDWIDLAPEPLPVAEALGWAIEPRCGGIVVFCGTVRDHAEGRSGVERLEYEAYDEGARLALAELARAARGRWPGLGRLALLHRTGALEVGEVAVVVLAAAPHREEAFGAARWCIDTLKQTVPIWKFETWADGAAWSECDHPLSGPLPADAGGGPR